jgi:hypothetical protein
MEPYLAYLRTKYGTIYQLPPMQAAGAAPSPVLSS